MPTGGKRSRDKGYRIEIKMRNMIREAGLECDRMPLSGAMRGFQGDLVIEDSYKGEVKGRALKEKGHGWKMVLNWLGKNDFLFLVQDGDPSPLVVMRFPWWKKLMLRYQELGNGKR